MYSDVTHDPFLSELDTLYENLHKAFYPYVCPTRQYNYRYKTAYKFFGPERKRLRKFVCNGLFVDNESRERVLMTLNRVIRILPTMPDVPVPLTRDVTPKMILVEAIRLRDMVELIDSLED